MQQQGLTQDVITYSALVSACEKGKQPERAWEVFHAMQQQGLTPSVITYNAPISVCEKKKQPERAWGSPSMSFRHIKIDTRATV